jgi:hypothetical protein
LLCLSFRRRDAGFICDEWWSVSEHCGDGEVVSSVFTPDAFPDSLSVSNAVDEVRVPHYHTAKSCQTCISKYWVALPVS